MIEDGGVVSFDRIIEFLVFYTEVDGENILLVIEFLWFSGFGTKRGLGLALILLPWLFLMSLTPGEPSPPILSLLLKAVNRLIFFTF